MNILSRIFRKSAKLPINERRRVIRYNVPLKLNYYNPLTKHSEESSARDISRNGLRFSVNKQIPKGTILDVKIEAPYNNTLICSKAKVIWVQEFVTGDDAKDKLYEIGVRLLKKKLY